MENEKDITILHGGLGGAQRYTVSCNASYLCCFYMQILLVVHDHI